jgi:hypothetical protein
MTREPNKDEVYQPEFPRCLASGYIRDRYNEMQAQFREQYLPRIIEEFRIPESGWINDTWTIPRSTGRAESRIYDAHCTILMGLAHRRYDHAMRYIGTAQIKIEKEHPFWDVTSSDPACAQLQEIIREPSLYLHDHGLFKIYEIQRQGETFDPHKIGPSFPEDNEFHKQVFHETAAAGARLARTISGQPIRIISLTAANGGIKLVPLSQKTYNGRRKIVLPNEEKAKITVSPTELAETSNQGR